MTTDPGYISHNQGIQGYPVRTFYLNIDHRQTTKMLGSNREPNLPATTDLIDESLKQRGGTSLLSLPIPRKGTGSNLKRHTSNIHL